MLLLVVLAPVHIATKALLSRSPWPRRFLRAAAWIVGARVRVSGRTSQPHSLLISNHLSWLDILVLGGSVGTAFVSKDGLGHPLIHWLADQNATVYVKRSHVKGARDQALALAAALSKKQPVTVFPEGTTGPGTHLLPFRSTLLEAANVAAKDVEIRPVVIDYGSAAAAIAWSEESAVDNILRVLGRPGAILVVVHLLKALPRSDRKQLALAARAAIAQRLGFKSPDDAPISADK